MSVKSGVIDPVVNLPIPPSIKSSEFLSSYKGWVYASVNHIATSFSSVKIKLFSQSLVGVGVNKRVEIVEVVDHRALDILHNVNDFMTFEQLKNLYATHMELLGEAAWALIRNKKGEIIEIWPLRPDWINVETSGINFIDHYIYYPGGYLTGNGRTSGIKLGVDDIIFFKDLSPTNMYRGMGRVLACATQIDIDNFSDETNRMLFYNSGMPSLIISTEKTMSKENKDRLIESFSRENIGRRNAHKVVLIDGGQTKIETLTTTPKELDFINSKKWVRDEILSIFNLSKADLGITDGVNKTNAREQEARKMRHVIKPRLVNFVGFLNEFYLKFFNDSSLFFSFADPEPKAVEESLAIYESGLKYGWLSVNEVRVMQGLQRVEGGDELRTPANLTPNNGNDSGGGEEGDKGDGGGEEGDKGDGGNEEGDKGKGKLMRTKSLLASDPMVGNIKLGCPVPMMSLKGKRDLKLEDKINNELIPLFGKLMKQAGDQGKDVLDVEAPGMDEEKRLTIWKSFISRTSNYERIFKGILKVEGKKQRDFVLKKLRDNKKTLLSGNKNILTGSSFVFSSSEFSKSMKKVFRKVLFSIIKSEGNISLDALVRRDLRTDASELLDYLSEEGDGLLFIDQINDTTREKLLDELEVGLALGETLKALSSRVDDVFKEFDEERSNTISISEVVASVNFGIILGYKQSEVTFGKEWLSARDSKVRSSHKIADGQVVKLDDFFIVGGEKARFPGDPRLSAKERVLCRGTTLPVSKDGMGIVNNRNKREEVLSENELSGRVKDIILNDKLKSVDEFISKTNIIRKSSKEFIKKAQKTMGDAISSLKETKNAKIEIEADLERKKRRLMYEEEVNLISNRKRT